MRRRTWWHPIAAFFLTRILSLYFKTLRLQVKGKERIRQELLSSSKGCIFLLWHDSLLLAPILEWATTLQPICILISNSRDGDLAAEAGKNYPNVLVIRVKHTSRTAALLESCQLLDARKSLLITPDGPKGPRHQMKLGALYASQKSGATIIPIVCAAEHQKTLSSWDRFRIPRPFSRVAVSFLEPISCPPEGTLDEIKAEIERRMEEEEKLLSQRTE